MCISRAGSFLPPQAPLVRLWALLAMCSCVIHSYHQYRASQPEPGDTNTSVAAVQDVSHLPTTSKGCLEGGIGRLPSWPALPPREVNTRVTCRFFCCGSRERVRQQGSRPPGDHRPPPQTVSLSLSPTQMCSALPSGWGPLQPLPQSQTSRNSCLASSPSQCPHHTAGRPLSLSARHHL